MALSFHALLVESTDSVHLYKVTCDGDRVAHVILDEGSKKIMPASSAGEASGEMSMSLESGNVVSLDNGDWTREEFALVASHIRSHWAKTGLPPNSIRKYFG
ncbi:hypothetical protein [Streptomyces natalensis]|uniref:hypothetical protein n=1 Tax=Streptomyces natalensis TaxID=68242 RepID=UPI000B0E1CCC|nr:hypothetical protein [Streptomyces natalensis]